MSGTGHLIPTTEFEKGIPEALRPFLLEPLGKYRLRLWLPMGQHSQAWEYRVLVLATEPMIGTRRGTDQYAGKYLVHIGEVVRWPDGESSRVCHVGSDGFWTDALSECTETVLGYFLPPEDVSEGMMMAELAERTPSIPGV